MESLGLLLKLVDGVLVLLHVPLGALIKGLPVTLCGRQRSLSLDSISEVGETWLSS